MAYRRSTDDPSMHWGDKTAYSERDRFSRNAEKNHGLSRAEIEAENRHFARAKVGAKVSLAYKNRKYSETPNEFDGEATVPFAAKDKFKDIMGKGNYLWDASKKTWRVKVKSIDRAAYESLSRLGVKLK